MNFFVEQGDFILCLQGFALVFLAVGCGLLGRGSHLQLPWSWLGVFAFIVGLECWLELLTPIFQGQSVFIIGSWALRVMALVALLEFGRRGWSAGRLRLVFWLYVLLSVVVIALAIWGGWRSVEMGSLWLLGLPAGLGAAVVLRRSAMRRLVVGGPVWMILAGGLLFLFVLMALILTPPAHPWNAISDEQGVGVLQLVRQGLPLVLGPTVALMLLLALQRARPQNVAPYLLWSVPALMVALAAGWVLSNFTSNYEETEQRTHLLQRSQIAAAALDYQLVAQLTGTAADAKQAAYFHVKGLLRLMQQRNADIQFIALFVWRHGRVVFLADSEPAISKECSAPGHVYEEASAEMRQALTSGVSFVEGPLVDRQGVRMSGFAPVRAAQGGVPVALLGMDVAASAWENAVFYHRLVVVGLTLLVSLLLLALYAGLQIVKESAQEIASSEGRFRALFENAPEAVFVFEADTGRILAANPFVVRWLGYAAEELVGKTLFDLAPAETRPTLEAALHAPGANALESVFHKKDGSNANVEITQAALHLYDQPTVLAYVRDVTERKQNDEKLHKTMSELERFNRLMVGRELRVLELKKEVNALQCELGRPSVYASVEQERPT